MGEKRRIYSTEEKKNLIALVEEDKKTMSVGEACQKHGITYQNYHSWNRRLKAQKAKLLRKTNQEAPTPKTDTFPKPPEVLKVEYEKGKPSFSVILMGDSENVKKALHMADQMMQGGSAG